MPSPSSDAVSAFRRPPLVAPGARVALIAPAGPLRDESELARSVDNARSMGWEPVVGAHAMARAGYFAGSDAARLADLNAAIADPRVDAIWCLRGGYGAMRLLDGVDYDALARRPRALLGYSDITALHAAVGVRCGLVSYHAPTARGVLTPFSRDSFERAVVRGSDPCGEAPAARLLVPPRDGARAVRGRLAGGNLALVSALAGTPFAPSLDGAILVLEDIGEAVYRMDRMLQQLRMAGMLRGIRALVFGCCTDCPEEAGDGARRLDDVLAEIAAPLGVPCVAGVPVGHIDDQWTLPLGAVAELDLERLALRVET